MSRLLVIGSKGFIGSHVFETSKKNFETWGCDVATEYEEKNYIQLSVVNVDFHEVFSKCQFDICVNCSGAASVPASIEEPLKDFELNTGNVYKILDAIRKYRPQCKFINLSSAAVYGNPSKLPITELASLQPLSPYGIHKMQAEEICILFNKTWHIQTCSLRIFSAYGPRLKKQLFWDLYKKSQASKIIELYGTGNETRDFIYVSDLVNAIFLIVENAKFEGETINTANGKQWSIKEVTDLFFHKLKWEGKIQFVNINRAGDPLNWEADITLLKKIGYQQQISMESGIEKYIQWLREKK